jgi:5-methylthioadenosine/S-adenosylhomocysteine deaminase
MNALGELIPQGAVVIKGRDIVAVGPADAVLAEWDAPDVVDCGGGAILPGLINTHTHVPMSLLRGLADDLRLDVWLFGYMMPVEREFVGPEFCRWGTLLSCAEMIRSGVTCFADMYYCEHEVARAAAEAGMRAICAQTVMKWPTPDAESYDEGLALCRDFVEAWKGHPLVTPAVGPHAAESSTPELLREAARLATEYDVPVLIHIGETSGGAEEARALYGMPSVEALERYGVLDARVGRARRARGGGSLCPPHPSRTGDHGPAACGRGAQPHEQPQVGQWIRRCGGHAGGGHCGGHRHRWSGE